MIHPLLDREGTKKKLTSHVPGICDEKVYEGNFTEEFLSIYYGQVTRKKVLDVGCGTGTISAFLAKNNNECYGITVSSREADLARERMTDVIVTDLEMVTTLPFSETFFDVVIFADVLEHLKNPSRTLSLIDFYLKPGGLLIASIPNVANFLVRMKLLLGRFDYEWLGILDHTHLRFFTLDTAKDLISSAGYVIQEIKYTNWNWNFPKFIQRTFSFCEWEIRRRITDWWPSFFATQFVFYARKPLQEFEKS